MSAFKFYWTKVSSLISCYYLIQHLPGFLRHGAEILGAGVMVKVVVLKSVQGVEGGRAGSQVQLAAGVVGHVVGETSSGAGL